MSVDRYHKLTHEQSVALELVEEKVKEFAKLFPSDQNCKILSAFLSFIMYLDDKIGTGVPGTLIGEVCYTAIATGYAEGLNAEEESKPKRKKGKNENQKTKEINH